MWVKLYSAPEGMTLSYPWRTMMAPTTSRITREPRGSKRLSQLNNRNSCWCQCCYASLTAGQIFAQKTPQARQIIRVPVAGVKHKLGCAQGGQRFRSVEAVVEEQVDR